MPRHTSSSSSTPHPGSSSRSERRSFSAGPKPLPPRSPSPAHPDSGKDVLKTSLVFLGVVGAASLAASKYWPKGILYGEKESWAEEAKKEVKHVLGGKSDSRENRRRPQSAGNGDRDTSYQRPRQVEIRDEVVVKKPDGRSMYMDTGWVRQPHNAVSERGRRRLVDSPDSRRSSDEPYRP